MTTVYLKRIGNKDKETAMQDILRKDFRIDDVVIRKTEKGKPYLPGKDLFINLSDSGLLTAFIIATEEVGIDLELVKENRRFDSLVKLLFADEEKKRYEELPKEEKILYFYRIWTSREAYVKMKGEGIGNLFYHPEPGYLRYTYSFVLKDGKDEYFLSVCLKNKKDFENIRFVTEEGIIISTKRDENTC